MSTMCLCVLTSRELMSTTVLSVSVVLFVFV